MSQGEERGRLRAANKGAETRCLTGVKHHRVPVSMLIDHFIHLSSRGREKRTYIYRTSKKRISSEVQKSLEFRAGLKRCPSGGVSRLSPAAAKNKCGGEYSVISPHQPHP